MDRFCEECGASLNSVGEEFVHTEIKFIPAKVRVIDFYRETFEYQECRKNGHDISRNPRRWIMTSYRDWLSTIVERLREELLKQGYLHIDETTFR